MRDLRSVVMFAIALLGAVSARATWSIIIVDSRTREIAIGSATCLTGLNLRGTLAVLRTEIGAAAAQSAVDPTGRNRAIIYRELGNGTDPLRILQILEDVDRGHQTRQYGIVDVHGRVATFTGSLDGPFAGDLRGHVGTLTYAIQGNVITGQPVLDAARDAILNTPGGLPEKLMAAMEAARAMGGDGRCSCDPDDPPGCGSPPPSFEKSAHIAFMLVARRGDFDRGPCSGGRGCAAGDYYLELNVAFQQASDPDPVLQLRDLFDAWRLALVGHADAIESRTTVTPDRGLNTGPVSATLRIELLDWQGLPATDTLEVIVEPEVRDTVGTTTIGTVQDLGNGIFEVPVTADTTPGPHRLLVTVRAPDGPDDDSDEDQIILIPSPTLWVMDAAADLNGDGTVDLADLSILLSSFGNGPDGDIDGDGHTDLADLSRLLQSLPG